MGVVHPPPMAASSLLKTKLASLSARLTRRLLERRQQIVHEGRTIFTVRNFGDNTVRRATSFSTKEPETLAWIDGFAEEDGMLDIGANIGIYSLYAAYRGHQVRCIEPDALNFALLNLNISDNRFGGRVIAYPFSIHSESRVAELHVGRYRWGGSHSSFDRRVNWRGEEVSEGFAQGSPGITVDDFVAKTAFIPNHVKIDVDGNEALVLRGASATLADPKCKSVLVELYPRHAEFRECISMIEEHGFAKAAESGQPDTRARNFIYKR